MAERDPETQACIRALEHMVGTPLSTCRSKDHVFQMLKSALSIQGHVHRELAKAGRLSLVQGKSLEFASATIGAIVRTLEASPLYDTPALGDQLVHSLKVHLHESTVEDFQPSDD